MVSDDELKQWRTKEVKAAIAEADAGDFATDQGVKAAFDAFQQPKVDDAEMPFHHVIREVQAFFATVGPKNSEGLLSEQLMRERRGEAGRERDE